MIEGVQVHRAVLSAPGLSLIGKLLASPSLSWSRRNDPTAAGRGGVLHLADQTQHETEAMQLVRTAMLGVVWRHVAPMLGGRTPEDVAPQMFPVVMQGNPRVPPTQLPHRDGSGPAGDMIQPLVTTVYYFRLDDVSGGNLLLFAEQDGEPVVRHTIIPALDQLVTMPGDQVHGVSPLFAGIRGSLVVNFYSAQ